MSCLVAGRGLCREEHLRVFVKRNGEFVIRGY